MRSWAYACRLLRFRNRRHGYAIDRYRELTGWKAPAAGGPPRSDLTGERKRLDKAARERISRELGHERGEIVRQYCG